MNYKITNTTDKKYLGTILYFENFPKVGDTIKLNNFDFNIHNILILNKIIRLINYNYIIEMIEE